MGNCVAKPEKSLNRREFCAVFGLACSGKTNIINFIKGNSNPQSVVTISPEVYPQVKLEKN